MPLDAAETISPHFEPEAVAAELETIPIDVALAANALRLPRFDMDLTPSVREARLLSDPPWARSLGALEMRVTTSGWNSRRPALEPLLRLPLEPKPPKPESLDVPVELPDTLPFKPKARIRPLPTADMVGFKDRLLYMLQPPLDNLFGGDQMPVPFAPFDYQLQGIGFLQPRHSALLADEMGLGKTMQTILAIRLLFQMGEINRVLLICPKPLVFNWCRELKLWSSDLPFEVLGGDIQTRRAAWTVSKCPLKLVNYEILTRDADILQEEGVSFDLVVLDEAQRIKNHDSRTAQVVRSVKRTRSWALTGTPIENRADDLVNIFSFVDPGAIPPETPVKMLASLTGPNILRRTKEDVMGDMPPRILRDLDIELTPNQRDAYDLAEKDGIVHLNELGDTITVQHVFQLVMRLKQICNFDPRTGSSAKLEQLLSDMEEVAENGRKAIVFSQWVQPLEVLAKALVEFGPLQFHGKIPSAERPAILDQFKSDPSKHVILMSYGTGSVGLNLQFTNYVFLFDRWWNPAIEDQAINRAHRIGQKFPVTVTRFTMETRSKKRIAQVLERKRQMFNELLAENGPPPVLGLTEEEIFGLFRYQAKSRTASKA